MKTKPRKSAAPLLVILLIIVGIIVIPKLTKHEETESGGQAIPVTQIKPESSDADSKQEQTRFNGKYLTDVPHVYQKDTYPTGCESVAAVSMLQYYGSEMKVEEFIDNHLPKTAYPYYEGKKMYGDNPWDAFIGDPYSTSGYGCYSTAIVKGLQSAVSDSYSVHALYNMPLQSLYEGYVKQGHPVLIWATIEMQEIQKSYNWTLPDGEQFTFVSPEHALLLIGADAQNYYFCDSMREDAVVSYSKAASEAAYAALHSQAVVAIPIS